MIVAFSIWAILVPTRGAHDDEGDRRLDRGEPPPQYKLGTWVAMLFAAGVGIDMLFYSVTGPFVQSLYPPSSEGGTVAAMQDAVVSSSACRRASRCRSRWSSARWS